MDGYSFFDRSLPLPMGEVNLLTKADSLGIKYFLPAMSSLHIGTRAPLIPKSAIETIQTEGFNFHGFSDFNFLGNQPECYAVPDPSTLIQCPWDPEIGWVACFLYYDGKPSDQCPRRNLIHHLKRAQAMGFNVKCGTELEFTILHPDKKDGIDPDENDASYQNPLLHLKRKTFFTQILDSMDKLDWGPYQLEHEFNENQYEINYGYTDALRCADRLHFCKFMLKSIGQKEGVSVTYMPQPFHPKPHYFGNGLHMHISLWDQNDRSVMADKDGFLGLSKTGRHFMNGLLSHLEGLTAIACPTTNSYKRLYINKNVSYIKAYGLNSRFPPIRIVQHNAQSNRVEFRLPDPSINPYLMTSAVLVAGLDGIEKGLEPDPALHVTQDLWDKDTPQHLEKLPRTLDRALTALRQDDHLMTTIGSEILRAFFVKKEDHVEQSLWEVTAFDLNLIDSY